MESVKKILFFNKASGDYAGIIESEELLKGLNTNLFLIKEINMKPTEYWFGDYETGKVYDKNIIPMVFEEDLYQKTYDDIIQHYPLYKQISIIIETLEKNKIIAKSAEFTEMVKFINSQKTRLKHKIKHMSSDPKAFNFISRRENDQNNMRPGMSS